MYYELPENITPPMACLNHMAAHIICESINEDEDIQEITAQYISCLYVEMKLLINRWKDLQTEEINTKASTMQQELLEWVDRTLDQTG